MLVLSRQRDETIMIGDEVEITVVDIRGDKVRLGINAPIRVSVHRKEVYEAIEHENQRAALVADPLEGIDPGRLPRTRPIAVPASAAPAQRGRVETTMQETNQDDNARTAQAGRRTKGGAAARGS